MKEPIEKGREICNPIVSVPGGAAISEVNNGGRRLPRRGSPIRLRDRRVVRCSIPVKALAYEDRRRFMPRALYGQHIPALTLIYSIID